MVCILNSKLCCFLLLSNLFASAAVFAQAEKEQENPIGKFFRNLNKDVRDGAEEIQKAQQGRDQLDARPPQNPDFGRRLDQAKGFLKQQRWEDAVSVLQFLIESESDSFYFNEDLELRSLHSEVQRMLNELPPDAARNYLNRFEPIAQRELEFAREFQDNSLLSRLANVFVKTEPGRTSAYTYALNLYDQGQMRAATDILVQLARKSESGTAARQYASLAAKAAAMHGNSKLVTQLLTEFDLPPEIDETTFQLSEDHVSDLDSTQLVNTNTQPVTKVDPQFIPLWTHQSVDRYLVEEQIQHLYSDLYEANRAIILSSQCLLNNQMIACQTLTGLEVRNSQTGELIWENRIRQSIESVLTDPAQSQLTDPVYRGRVPEQHPVVSLLLRDGISRSLTTDGRHLFAIEKHELLSNPTQGYSWQRRMIGDSPENEKYKTNEIVAYDFATGRIRWRLGGKVLEEPFTRPLAGTFFFGPPVSDGSDLYVIGEREEIISLFALNAQTGEVLWSQEIAHPSRSLAHDQVRRFWPCFPAIQDGVIVCPTTCGWLVAVDQASHQLMWASRYTPRKKSKKTRAFAIQSIQDLNRRWLTSPPVIVGNRVLFTPQELPNEFNQEILATYCFDLSTGNLLWQEEKGDGLYLAGIYQGNAVFVGQSSVVLREIGTDGHVLWKTDFGTAERKPSGRSLILDHELLVPINGETLIQINLDSGKISKTSRLESSEMKLGSLYYENDKLFSLSTFHASAFPVQQLTEKELEDLPKSFSAELISIEYLISNQKYSAALDAVQQLRSQPFYQKLTIEERVKIEEIEWNCMEQLVLSESEFAEETLFSMQTIAESPAEISRYRRLAAMQEIRAEHWQVALQHLFLLLKNSPSDQFFTEGTRTVRADAWVGGQLLEIYDALNSEDQKEFVTLVQEELGSLRKSLGRHRLARVVSFLELGKIEEVALAKESANHGRITEAIMRLQRVSTSKETAVAAKAWLEMATLFEKVNAITDAKMCLDNILELESVELNTGDLSHQVAQQRLNLLNSKEAPQPRVEWGETWEAFRTGSQGAEQTLKSLATQGLPFEFQKSHKYLFQLQNQRLFIEKKQTGEYIWSLPLRSMSNVNHRSNVGILQTGAVSYVVHRGVLHALHTLDQKIAWTHLPEVTGSALSRLRTPSSRSTSVVNNLSSFRNLTNLSGNSSPTGILLEASEKCVLVIDDEIHALDPITGELLWTESKVGNRVTAKTMNDQILLCDKDRTELRRSIDGKTLKHKFSSMFQEDCLKISNGQFLYLTQGEEADDEWSLSQGTLENKTSDWNLEIDPESLIVKFDEFTYATISPSGELFLIDLTDGSQRSIGMIPGDLLKIQKRIYAYDDEEFVFLAVAHGNGRTSYVNLPSLRASGTLICYSKTEGQLWSQNTEALAKKFSHQKLEDEYDDSEKGNDIAKGSKIVWSMNLIVAELEDSPLLLFISDRPEHRNKIYFRRLTMVGLDKRTGEPVFDWYRISNSGGFSYLHVDVRDRHIDLRTYNERLKIQPVRQQKVSATVGDQ